MVQSRNTDTLSWGQVLNTITNQIDFIDKIKRDGFSEVYSFSDIIKRYNFTPRLGTPTYLSLDFLSLQQDVLREKGLQIIRTGSGKFIILDSHQISSCYLDLKISSSSKIEPRLDRDFPYLSRAFEETQEDVALEQLNFLGIYDSMIEDLFGKQKWYVGPRGGRRSNFSVYGRKINELKLMYNFDGPEELDYTIWTKDHILLFEAKSMAQNKGLDIGWHKIAYTAFRFHEFKKYKILPVYLLKWEKIMHIFVFPIFKFYQDGIVLNDVDLQKPERIFRVELT